MKNSRIDILNIAALAFLSLTTGSSIAQPAAHSDITANTQYINSLPYTIEKSGHYKLSRSLVTTSYGILVAANDVIIDLNGQSITGPLAPDTTSTGIASFGHHHIEVRNGDIQGFQYGVYLSGYSDSAQSSKDLGAGGHIIERLNITKSSFRGIRIEGAKTVIRENKISNIGGDITIDNAYAMGIESYGENVKISNNEIEKVLGTGVTDISEGVGISLTRFGSGSVVEGNRLDNGSLEIPVDSSAWLTRSRSSYGIWVGGDGIANVLVANNTVKHFKQGVTFKRSESGALRGNNVTASVIPYYLPDDHKRTRVRDLGGNTSDEQNLSLKLGRATPGQVETIEPPVNTYLSPLHRLKSPAFLPITKNGRGDTIIEGNNAANNMVDYWYPVYPGRAKRSINVDLKIGKAWSCCETDQLVNIQGAQGTPYEDFLRGNSETNLLAGGAGTDQIKGEGGDDFLFGDEGDDELWGGEGNDFLDGGPDNDVLRGGPGSDIFAFWTRSGTGHDVIIDFTVGTLEHDIMDFAGVFHSYEEVIEASTQVGKNTVITLTADDTVTLQNVQKHTLSPSNFKF